MANLVDDESVASREKDNKNIDGPKIVQHSGQIAVGDSVAMPDASLESKNPIDAIADTFIATDRELLTIWANIDPIYSGRETRKIMAEKGISIDAAVDQRVLEDQSFLDSFKDNEARKSSIVKDTIRTRLLSDALMSFNGMEESEKPAYLVTLWKVYEEFATFEELKDVLWTDDGLLQILDYIRTVVHNNSESEITSDAINFFHAAELAYERKFDDVRATIEGMHSSPALQAILLERLAEAENTAPRAVFDEQSSRANISNVLEQRGAPSITPDQLSAANMRITIGTSFEAVDSMLEQPYGRYLSVHEHGTSGGMTVSSSSTRNSGYREFRKEVETTLGYSPNVFLPRPVYGAVTSDFQIDRASGYGQIALVIKEDRFNDQDATFYKGDSLDKSGRPRDVVPRRQINARDAMTFYASQVEAAIGQGRDLPRQLPYTEAHVAGLHLKDVEKVVLRCETGDVQRVSELANKLTEQNVPAEVVFDWRFNSYIKRLMDEGQSEEDAYKSFVDDLRQKFGNHDGLTFTFIVDEQKPRRGRSRANTALLEYPDIMVKQPPIDDLSPPSGDRDIIE